ncbi:hypothetical protein [Methylobacterium soli]|uniref:Uncharacterized protein n=1 Tax=Methylobacterium soli TaxID=553447 RepID=A0A6L3SWZ6_9HYPH|nr:hypothetical protein [Methylobacterium soli]KAB1076685.1 hypothetical protein F6X53_22605 [Methylobacterium soli]GJE43490.1 hypothetical protein AEGHOMDF_2669 [Methylobacterium soli]
MNATALPDKAPDDTITITLKRSEAGRLGEGMADLLCWCRGYMAGRPEHDAYSPMGVEETRTVRLAILDALNSGRTRGMPF